MANLKDLKSTIKRILTEHPELKDNDNSLCTQIWREELRQMGCAVNCDAYSFFKRYAKGEMSLAPSIKRARAKLQEDEEKMRGKNYKKRKGLQY